jgi:hypothetical protein
MPKQNVSDDFRCLVVDPGFDTKRFLTGFETIVDNTSVLHHQVVFVVGPDSVDELAVLEAEDDQPGYECFGDARVENQIISSVWAPGGGRTGFPAGTGLPIEPGSRIVIQHHYNVADGTGPDNSGVRYWFTPEGETVQEGQFFFLGNLPFEIPPGVNGMDVEQSECETVYASLGDVEVPEGAGMSVREARDTPPGRTGCVQQDFYLGIPIDVTLHGLSPHMHLVGKGLEIEYFRKTDEGYVPAEPQAEENQCLISTDKWDFNWQRLYWYDEPLRIPGDSMIRVTCRYDSRGQEDTVTLGDGSGNEMCLGLFYMTL